MAKPTDVASRVPDLYVLNLNRNFTGVSATAAAVLAHQTARHNAMLVGNPLPGCPQPVTLNEALRTSRTPPHGKPFSIWHVRRNSEMRAGILARDVLRRPVRLVFTSAAQRRHSLLPRWLISRMDAVIATSEHAASFVPHVRAVVPHGVDTDRFHPADDRTEAWRNSGFPGVYGIATIGRIRKEKGTDLFVRAMIAALPALPDATALVIGRADAKDAGFLASLKSAIEAAGMGERILFVGEVEAEAMPALMRSLSLVVQLPRYEGYGVVPLEAMASGVPFVASDTGSYGRFANGGESGLIVPLEDWQAAAGAVASILGDGALHAKMAGAARVRAHQRFSVGAESEAINRVYEDLWAEAIR